MIGLKKPKKEDFKTVKTYLDALLYAKECKEYEVLLENSILNDLELNAIFDICIEDVISTYLLEMKTLAEIC